MKNLLSLAAVVLLVAGCAAPPRPPTAAVGGPPDPGPTTAAEPGEGAAIAAELGFHGPRERTDLKAED